MAREEKASDAKTGDEEIVCQVVTGQEITDRCPLESAEAKSAKDKKSKKMTKDESEAFDSQRGGLRIRRLHGPQNERQLVVLWRGRLPGRGAGLFDHADCHDEGERHAPWRETRRGEAREGQEVEDDER